MNIIDAAHKTVKSYPGGSESLAPRIGMSAAVLRNKVNPNNHTHHLSLAEASEIMGITDDLRILDALAAEHGCIVVRHDVPSCGSLIADLLSAAALKGELAAQLAEAYADRRISPNERDRIVAIIFRLIAKLGHMARHAETAAKAGEAA